MRIGICAYWFNRGQAVVARHLRSALEELGHETFVLARPTRATNIKPSWIDRKGVWNQPGVTAASAYEIPWSEYEAWAADVQPDLVFFDQNYQLEEIRRLRESGVKTVGRFVWEQFSEHHTEDALAALDVLYSLTLCEQERYRGFGIESPYVPWGIHPELLAFAPDLADDARAGLEPQSADGPVRFFFPGGFMSKRKPFEEVIEAFRETSNPDIELVLKAQVKRRKRQLRKLIRREGRIDVVVDDLPHAEYMNLFAGCDVCVAPSRWEGLGLHLYEATAFGMPILTNDNPPMNEIVTDGLNGIAVQGLDDGIAKSGIPAHRPDKTQLTAAFERLADRDLLEQLRTGARQVREQRAWHHTVAGIAGLIDQATSQTTSGPKQQA